MPGVRSVSCSARMIACGRFHRRNRLATHLEVPKTAFAEYARCPQTMTDHARLLAATIGLRPAGRPDLALMIEAAAQAA